jgi:hypothetical protein
MIDGNALSEGPVMVRCDELIELIEPCAAGELTPSPAHAAHLQSCPDCSRALAMAQQVERAFDAIAWPALPAAFAQDVARRIRTDRWREEQLVDRTFNFVLAGAGVVVSIALWIGLEWSGATVILGRALSLAGESVARSMGTVPVEPIFYAVATLGGVAALVIWRWREGDQFF